MNRKSYYSSSTRPAGSSSYYYKRQRSPSPVSRSPISPAPKRVPPPPPISAPSPISSASNITPPEVEQVAEISDPRKSTMTSNFQCQCLRPEEEIIFPGGLPRFVQEGRVDKNVSLFIKTQLGLRLETVGKVGNSHQEQPQFLTREPWLEGCRVLLLQGLPEQVKIGNSWRNFVEFSGISGLVRAELLSGESFSLSNATLPGLDAALLIFTDEISAKNVYLKQQISVYGQDLLVLPDPHFLRTLQLAAASIFARLPRRSTPTSPATPDDSAPRFGGGLSRRAKQPVVLSGARHALRLFMASEVPDESFWKDRGANSCDRLSQRGLLTIRFPRAALRDACLAYVPVPVRIMDVAELVISMTEHGLVAVVETLTHDEQEFAPLRGELEDVR